MQKLKGKGYENRGIAVDIPQNQSLRMKDVACERERACNIGIAADVPKKKAFKDAVIERERA